jgi:hypothetical protein
MGRVRGVDMKYLPSFGHPPFKQKPPLGSILPTGRQAERPPAACAERSQRISPTVKNLTHSAASSPAF